MILYRLIQNCGGLMAGSCITEEKYKSVYYLDKPLFEPIQEFEIKDMIEYKDEGYCILNGIDKMLFYTPTELNIFIEKLYEGTINN